MGQDGKPVVMRCWRFSPGHAEPNCLRDERLSQGRRHDLPLQAGQSRPMARNRGRCRTPWSRGFEKRGKLSAAGSAPPRASGRGNRLSIATASGRLEQERAQAAKAAIASKAEPPAAGGERERPPTPSHHGGCAEEQPRRPPCQHPRRGDGGIVAGPPVAPGIGPEAAGRNRAAAEHQDEGGRPIPANDDAARAPGPKCRSARPVPAQPARRGSSASQRSPQTRADQCQHGRRPAAWGCSPAAPGRAPAPAPRTRPDTAKTSPIPAVARPQRGRATAIRGSKHPVAPVRACDWRGRRNSSSRRRDGGAGSRDHAAARPRAASARISRSAAKCRRRPATASSDQRQRLRTPHTGSEARAGALARRRITGPATPAPSRMRTARSSAGDQRRGQPDRAGQRRSNGRASGAKSAHKPAASVSRGSRPQKTRRPDSRPMPQMKNDNRGRSRQSEKCRPAAVGATSLRRGWPAPPADPFPGSPY